MIDPLISLAYSIHSNRGVFALLIGSGVSRAAGIPTGWEIVLDLVTKVAHLHNEDCSADPAGWYRQKYGEEPDYSKLLDELAKSPEERQQLLAAYFEPTESEREAGLKSPTKGHRAIAKLVASGHIRVILTTNFDRLLERAIEMEGVTPIVLSTPDAIRGALPLVHQRCCIVKLHGDYLDTRIKNTPNELERYSSPVNKLLSRILDEFGVIACGWSAQWDTALRAAFERCTTRRFTTYFASRGELASPAKRLLDLRSGVIVTIKDADSFLEGLAEKVLALEDLNQPHPLSSAAAGATTKRLLSEDKNAIRLHDLVIQETERTFDALQPIFESLLRGSNQAETFNAAIKEFLSQLEIIGIVAQTGAYWSRRSQFHSLLQIHIRLASDPRASQGGLKVTASLRLVPSAIIFYQMGISSLAAKNYEFLADLLSSQFSTTHEGRQPYITAAKWREMQGIFKLTPPHENAFFAFSEWLYLALKPTLRKVIPSEEEYDRLFDQFEMIRALVYIDISEKGVYGGELNGVWAPGGRFVWKRGCRQGDLDLHQILDDEHALGMALCNVGLFAKRPETFSIALERFQKIAVRMSEKYC